MAELITIVIASDFHYAGPAERALAGYETRGITHFFYRHYCRAYYDWVWMPNLTAQYFRLDQFLATAPKADWLVVNGDYSCDTGFVGVSDPNAYASAAECLRRLRDHAPSRFAATIGDHELGKRRLGDGRGGLRAASFRQAVDGLQLRPFWEIRLERYVLMGVTSTLLALPVYEREGLPEEAPQWRAWREQHLAEIRAAFEQLAASDRVILFCHDPTALPYLAEVSAVVSRLAQIERTIIGHLHTPSVFKLSRWLAGMPEIRFLGNVPRRLSAALRRARDWRPFNVALCPSPAGVKLFKDGGYLTLQLDLAAQQPAQLSHHPLPWDWEGGANRNP